MTEFEGVVPALGQALSKRGYDVLTPVQKQVIAPELGNADALVSAQTGSGKTVAFGLALAPMLLDGAERFDRAKTPLALVVAPTRELALQVTRELEWLYEMTGATVVSCVGGMDGRTERRNLERGAHIVVGTPGRLCDHIDRRALNISALKAVVLDEADEMLDLGFREDLEFILDAAPADRRTLMFSATVPRSIATLAKRYQRDAVRVVTSEEQKQHLDIEYRSFMISPKDQENAIINVLRYFEAKNALVFCGTRVAVNHMTARFNNRGFSVVALSGELSQNERSHALQSMRDGRARVCIATDVAARGIDLPNLELVIHADLPKNPESLLHRSGRTGRAGRKGVSVLIVPHKARKRTERLMREANITSSWALPPSVEDIMRRDDERILADQTFSEPMTDDEQVFAKELLDHHSAEQIAAAFVRLYRNGQSAPEELMDAPVPDRKTKQTDNFENGAWISLSVGRRKNAEPRWLLAMLCRVGDLTNRDIGAIRIHQGETHVELESGCVDKFFKAVGPDNVIEKGITVTRLDHAPEAPADTYEKPFDKTFGNKKKFSRFKGGDRGKPAAKPHRKFAKQSDERPEGDKPWAKNSKKPADKKPSGKKPFKSKSENKPSLKTDHKPSSRRPKTGGAGNTGSSPLMRKRPKKAD
jgi:ATP-dependent RNA helicase DeaD